MRSAELNEKSERTLLPLEKRKPWSSKRMERKI